MTKAYSAKAASAELELVDIELAELKPEQVEIDVHYCGICHSDLSMLNNDWQMTEYPFVPGHEIVGQISQIGSEVKYLEVGQTVGLGWFTGSCKHCYQCMSGNHNLCLNDPEQTIVNRPGGFAEKIRTSWEWATPLPSGINIESAGPLFCGGVTVFNPIVQFDVKPTDRVGVVGIGGLGHMAIQFLNHWGCEVTAFTSTAAKAEEAKKFGADKIVNSRSDDELDLVAGSYDFIISTVNANLNWEKYINALAPKGRFHTVGAVPEPIQLQAFPMIVGQKSFSGSPLGSPATISKMLEFCARHRIAPQIETFPMSEVNKAFKHLESGQARYRIVLAADW